MNVLTDKQRALIARSLICAFVLHGGLEFELLFLGQEDTMPECYEAIGRGMRHIALLGWSPADGLEVETFEDLTPTGEQALMAARSAFFGALANLSPKVHT